MLYTLALRPRLCLLWALCLGLVAAPVLTLSLAHQLHAQPVGEVVYAITNTNRLIQFNSSAPQVLTGSRLVSGLLPGESLLGMDFRPADGRLYALGSSNRLYTLNAQTGAASLVAVQPISPTLSGLAFGFDFNPAPDRIRVVSDAEQNLRLHPATGALAGLDSTLAYTTTDVNTGSDPQIAGAAYTNNISGATTTTLYVLDANLDILARQGGANGPPSPNSGLLFTVGALGIDATNLSSFDISPSGAAYVANTPTAATSSDFYTLDLAVGSATLVGVIGGFEPVVALAVPTVPPPPLPQEPLVALTSANRLILFNSATPAQLTAANVINGLQPGEKLLGIDFRPATGQLYGLGSSNRLYTLDPATGLATLVSTQPLSATLSGAAYGFDFNPVPDRIRVVSDAEQNLRLHPLTGAVAGIDVTLTYSATDVNAGADPQIVGAAYSNNISGATSTTLYGLDANLDILVRQGGLDGPPSPNTGLLSTVGPLGADADAVTGFDITPSGLAFVTLRDAGGSRSHLAWVNLSSGLVTRIGAIGGEEAIVGLAAPTVAPPPPPTQRIFAVTSINRLIGFYSSTPGVLTSAQPISGLQAGESVLGIDFRPANGQLYALGSSSRLYTIDLLSGAASVVGTQPFSTTLNGSAFGFDFNPAPDRIRVVSNAEQNLRLHPATGGVAGVDATLAYSTTDRNTGGDPHVVAAAYSNNISGATSTTLYVLDANLDILATQGGANGAPSPNSGRLFSAANLEQELADVTGFDITPNGAAFAASTDLNGAFSNFYVVDLASGKLRLLGAIGGSETVVGIAAPTMPLTPPSPPPEPLFAVTSANRLIRFNNLTPGVLTSAQPILGLQFAERIVGIDFRPANGQLYALGSSNRLYTIDPQSGVASMVGAQPFTTSLNGLVFGFDFNPVPDRIRVVSDVEQNVRLHPVTGGVAGIDNTLAYSTTDVNAGSDPMVAAAAYTNNFSGATTTTLYGIDTNRDTLVRQGGLNGPPSPNGGQLLTVGALGVNATEWIGFDISPAGFAYATISASSTSTSSLYLLDLTTGSARWLGDIGSPETIVGLSAPTIPPPPPPAQAVFAVTSANRLIRFSSATPGTLTGSLLIKGLQPGENLLGLDFRPADGQLYGLGSSHRLYTIDPWTGTATPMSSQPLSITLNGGAFGFDFNPAPDRIRVVSDAEQNLRLHPVTGAVVGIDATLAYSTTDVNNGMAPTVVGAAYSNNLNGATSTTLYVLDAGLDTLAIQGGPNGAPSPNTGRLFTVGHLGVDIGSIGGFDIGPTGAAFVASAAPTATTSSFYVLDLASGQLSWVGEIGINEQVMGLTMPTAPLAPPPTAVFAVTTGNRLIQFNSIWPGVLTSVQQITGLQPGENILGIDFRPATNQLYGLSSSNRLYVISLLNAAATPVGAPLVNPLNGVAFGFDFNPVPDRVRVVSEANQNLRLHPDTGAVAGIDATLAYSTTDGNAGVDPTVVAVAYTNNVTDATSTTLYVIDAGLDRLAIQGGPNGTPSPNTGTLFSVGSLGVDVNNLVSFDIAPSGAAYAAAAAASGPTSNFYTVDLASGQLVLVGPIAAGEMVVGLAVPTRPRALTRLMAPMILMQGESQDKSALSAR